MPPTKARDSARRLAGKDGLLAALQKDTLDALIAEHLAGVAHDRVLGDTTAPLAVAAVAGTRA